jgi:hypothetical protein
MDGPLEFLGHEVEGTGRRTETDPYLLTYWRVVATTGRPFSIMAHAVGRDGLAISVGDGLGVPLDSMQVGDVIVQRHDLPQSEGQVAGVEAIETGAYWLDTMERWAVLDADKQVGDRIVLTSFEVR